MANVQAPGQFMASPEDNIKDKIGSYVNTRENDRILFGGNKNTAHLEGTMSSFIQVDVDLTSKVNDTKGYSSKKSMLANIMETGSMDFENFHNFDVVMSHTMSESDYEKAREDGFDMKDLNPSEAVTILDKVKTVLAKSGQIIDGFNDDIDKETLINITKDELLAKEIIDSFHENDIPLSKDNIEDVIKAIEKGSLLDEPLDNSRNYLVENNLKPSIDNFYLADHATNGRKSGKGSYYIEGGYLNKIAEDENYEEIDDQILDVIKEAGLYQDDKNMLPKAKSLLKDGILLTPDNLKKRAEIDDISFPLLTKDIVSSSAVAISEGKKASLGDLSKRENLVKKAVQLSKALFAEETRLNLSAEVNLRLLRKGIEIDTSYAKEAVEELKAAKKEISDILFPGEENAEELYDLYQKTGKRVAGIKESPAAVIGAITKEFKGATLEDIFNKAVDFKASYDKAFKNYETVGTQVRKDLGDNIQKAFRNVDELLKNMELEISEDNRRAVRILSYNHTDVTKQSVETVKALDSKLVNTIDNLKPKAVLEMIREGRNPLSMTLDELGNYLSDKDKGTENQTDKYSRFLYKLEHTGQITDEEKESYIGIYRLFENLKATDHAAIGMLLNTNASITIGNLLAANRSLERSKRPFDFRVDDNFGGMEIGDSKNVSIDYQIETAFRYYSSKADKAYDNMSPEKLLAFEKAGNDIEKASLPEFADAMEEDEINLIEKEYNQKEIEDIRNALSSKLAGESAAELKDAGIELTVRNLEAMEEIIASRKKKETDNIWDRLRDSIKAPKKETFDENDEINELKELDSYIETVDNLKEKLEEEIDKADTYIDLKALRLLHKELSITAKLADKGSFEIPIEIGDREVSLHISFKSRKDESLQVGSRIEAGIDTENFGYVKADFSILDEEKGHTNSNDFSGVITTSKGKNPKILRFMENIKSIMVNELKSDEISIMYEVEPKSNESDKVAVSREADTTDERLVKTAELFIKAVTDTLSMMDES